MYVPLSVLFVRLQQFLLKCLFLDFRLCFVINFASRFCLGTDPAHCTAILDHEASFWTSGDASGVATRVELGVETL